MGDTGLTWPAIVITYNSSSSYHRSYPSRRCRLRDDDWADCVVTLVMKVLSIPALSICLGHFAQTAVEFLSLDLIHLREVATSTCVPIGSKVCPADMGESDMVLYIQDTMEVTIRSE